MILRGSREFSSREEYGEFLRQLLARRNEGRRDRVAEDLKALRPLPERRLDAYSKQSQKVSRNSTIVIRHNHYSVPSQLIGERVDVRIYANHLEVWYAGKLIEQMERLRGEGKAAINYRHIIHSLVKKPGAFERYRFQSSLYPRVIFRVAYDELKQRLDGRAEREYLQLLKLAAEESEDLVAEILRGMVERGEAIRPERVREMIVERRNERLPRIPKIEINTAPLQIYDLLLSEQEVEHEDADQSGVERDAAAIEAADLRHTASAQSALAASEGWSCDQYLLRLCEMEINERETRKRERLLQASRLPREKTLENFERG